MHRRDPRTHAAEQGQHAGNWNAATLDESKAARG